jgi:cytoskeletal protein RodZ
MALSMDEQRMLAEIERRLAAQDPGLANRLSSFKRPSPAARFKTTRGKIIGSISAIALLAIIAITIYATIPFRANNQKVTKQPTATSAAVRTSAPTKRAATSAANASAAGSTTVKKTTSSLLRSGPFTSVVTKRTS